jgi:AcrR family transcriptional regulator
VNFPASGTVARRKRASSYHHGQLRQALLALGRRELVRHGWQTLSLRALARRLSVSHAAAYRHFADKEALLSALAAAAMEDFADALEAAERAAASEHSLMPTASAALIAIGTAYVEFALARPHEFRLMFSGDAVPASRDPQFRAANDRASQPVLRLASRVINATTGHDPERGTLSTELALQLWAMVHGVAVLLIERQFEEGRLRTPDGVTTRERATLAMLARGIARMVGSSP